MIAMFMVISLCIMILLTGMFFDKFNIIKLILFGNLGFWGLYILVSGTLFTFDIFSILKAIVIEVVIELLLLLVLLFKKKRFDYSRPKKEMLIILFICALGLLLSWQKYEFFGMGQDQGDYQTKAILLMNGTTENSVVYNDYTYEVTINEDGTTTRKYHAIPTFPAILGLWGSVFGMAHMAGVQSVFFVSLLLLLYFIGGKLKLRLDTKILVVLAGAISPVILWVSKSSLTEMFLAVIMANFIYWILDDSDYKNIWVTSLSILVFAFYHVSLYTLMPMFVILYFLLYAHSGNKRYLAAQCFNIISFLLGLLSIYHVNKKYTIMNFKPVFFGPINKENILFICVAAGVLVILASALLYVLSYERIRVYMQKLCGFALSTKIFAAVICILLVLNVYLGREDIRFLTIFGYLFTTGFIIFPITLILLLYRLFSSKGWKLEKNHSIILCMFFYCIIIHTTFFRNVTFHYYYYSRYIVPFVGIFLLEFALLFDSYKMRYQAGVGAIAVIALFPANILLFTQPDDSRMQWSCLQEVAETVDTDNAAAIVTEKLNYSMLFTLPALTDTAVYEQKGDLIEQMNDLSEEYDDVYVVTDNIYLETQPDHIKVNSVYKNINHISEDGGNKHGRGIPYPTDFEQSKMQINVYALSRPQYKYELSEEATTIKTGFAPLEGTFCWMNQKEAALNAYLDKADYNVYLEQANGIPIDWIGKDIHVKVFMNGNFIGESTIDEDSDLTLKFHVKEEFVEDGWNELEIESDLWNPSEAGISEDTRDLGISLVSVEYKKK